MSEQQDLNNNYPKVKCQNCNVPMDVVGIGSASGKIAYQCQKCGAKHFGKNLAAMQLGSLGGKARAASLSSEDRQKIAEKAGHAFAEKMREKRRNQRLT